MRSAASTAPLPSRAQLGAVFDAAGAIVEVEQVDPVAAGGPDFDMFVCHDVEVDVGIAAIGHGLANLIAAHAGNAFGEEVGFLVAKEDAEAGGDRKSTRLNSSH